MSKRKQWSAESMAAAVREIEEEGMGLREAARLYNLPVESLRRRIMGMVSIDCRPGPPTILTSYEEDRLARYCVEMSDMGFGLGREEVMHTAFLIVERSGRNHPFHNGKAGRAWFDCFCSRHPQAYASKTRTIVLCKSSFMQQRKNIGCFWKISKHMCKAKYIKQTYANI